ncbi:pyrimidine reductase family protein [Microbacterium halophytorum]|uniref:pyrimidine reductase family protein n=1 Tax=Microbacterium halophytorum TaxID=2067568 RepID=UPI000CFD44F7|nr:pyrimidine reductase family protein [Microbacterium halophytorum]
MTARIDRLWPDQADDLNDDDLLDDYAFPPHGPWLRMNFVTSLDGAATREGRSGGLGDDADRRVFELLRRPAHAVLVAAGTVRTEGYAAMRVDQGASAWRMDRGLSAHPVFALVTRSLDLDPASPVFADAPVRPIVYTCERGPAERRAALARVADVVACGEDEVDLPAVKADLAGRGLTRVHSEGGPSLFGAMLAQGAVDELCLTLAPTLESGDGPRIASSGRASPTDMRLVGALRAGDELLLRYRRR